MKIQADYTASVQESAGILKIYIVLCFKDKFHDSLHLLLDPLLLLYLDLIRSSLGHIISHFPFMTFCCNLLGFCLQHNLKLFVTKSHSYLQIIISFAVLGAFDTIKHSCLFWIKDVSSVQARNQVYQVLTLTPSLPTPFQGRGIHSRSC